MNAKNETQVVQQDTFKWVTIWGLLIAGIVVNYYFASYALVFRLLGGLVLLGVVTFIVSFTVKGQQLWMLAKQSRVEMRKVVWPTRQETVQTTLIVVAMVIVMALVLWGLDALLLWAIGFLTGQRG